MRRRWLDILLMLLGIWLVTSTWIMEIWVHSPLAAWVHAGGGALAAAVAILDLRRPAVWDEWILFILGALLSFSPLFIDYGATHNAMIQAVVGGLLLIILTTAAGNARHWREAPSGLNRHRH